MGSYRLGVLHGDHIGPEIVPVTVDVLRAAAAAESDLHLSFEELPVGLSAFERTGTTLPQSTVTALGELDAFILGPVSHHLYDSPGMINPSGYFRTHFQLFANVRPAVSMPGVACLRPDVDIVIVRENTEGFYSDRNLLDRNGEFRPNPDTVLSMRVVNRHACRRIARYAFELAASRRGKVTAVHKANIFKHGCGMFLEECRRAREDWPTVDFEDYHVDAFAMHLINRPGDFDVVVTTNLFGDILSDEAAALTGGLGLAASLNVGDDLAMAQAVHGSAPDIAGRGIANPCALVMSGAMLLDWLGQKHGDPAASRAAGAIVRAVSETIGNDQDPVRTPDLGGQATTAELGQRILQLLTAPRAA